LQLDLRGKPVNTIQPSSAATQPTTDSLQWQQIAEGIGSIVVKVAQALNAFFEAAAWEWEQAERAHHRGELRAAYQVRRDWKRSDRSPLASLSVNGTAQRRMLRLSRTGRPVVKLHQTLAERIAQRVAAIQALAKEDSSPEQRRKAFKEWPWYEYHVEAIYRGEHLRAKAQSRRGASRFAEDEVGEALGISSSAVHHICCKVRRVPREDNGFPPMTVNEFETWMSSGKHPSLAKSVDA
jgi:hypothetical protein